MKQQMKQQLILLLVLTGSLVPQTAVAPASDETVSLVQKATVRALTFEQGVSASLNKARPDFTPQGWEEFMKPMQGFLDANGAPQFSSKFIPVGNAVITSEKNGVIQLKIPGTLTQTQGKSSTTTYRLRIEVRATGTPPKIEHLDQITCPKASAATYCM